MAAEMRKELAGHVAGGPQPRRDHSALREEVGQPGSADRADRRGFNRLAWLLPYGVGLGGIVLVGGIALALEPPPRGRRRSRCTGGGHSAVPRSRIVSTMSSGTSTERGAPRRDSGFQPWHFYILLSLAGATWAVIVSPNTHPAALLLLSASIWRPDSSAPRFTRPSPASLAASPTEAGDRANAREFLEHEKALVLRSIKELEFDRAMRKVSDQDFAEIGGRLRARALALMQALDGPVEAAADDDACRAEAARGRSTRRRARSCDTPIDADARFCKHAERSCDGAALLVVVRRRVPGARARTPRRRSTFPISDGCPACRCRPPTCRPAASRSASFAEASRTTSPTRR